jgi:maltose alpha-D-glucosyltransferase/alpha-amylase
MQERAERPPVVDELIGPYLGLVSLLGRRAGELHLALATPCDDPAFTPESYGSLAKRSYYQSLRNLAARAFDELSAALPGLAPEAQEPARELLKRRREVMARLDAVRDGELGGKRIRVHGDFHLGQVLYTGKDFVIIDFEGEPARSLSHRRSKRSPMVDVAGMLRSFHYVCHAPLSQELTTQIRPSDAPALGVWASVWYGWVARAFTLGYFEAVQTTGLLPESRPMLGLLLDVTLLEKALYEVSYELNNRPSWAGVPVRGIIDVLDGSGAAG